MAASSNRAANSVRFYRKNLRVNLGDWLQRPLDTITRQDVEDRFNLITGKQGWAAANQTLSMLRSIYRRPFVHLESLRNPVELWLAGGGRFNPKRRWRISGPESAAVPKASRKMEQEKHPGPRISCPGRPRHYQLTFNSSRIVLVLSRVACFGCRNSEPEIR